jgi:hypothetical protein
LAFNIREGIRGLEHLRLAACRKMFKMNANHYIQRYADSGMQTEVYLDHEGKEMHCERCGFVFLKVSLGGGWTMQTCSALPIVKLRDASFREWVTSLTGVAIESAKAMTTQTGAPADDCIAGKSADTG